MFQQMLKKSIYKSQKCQRNWDLSKDIPKEDINVILTSATQCPSKQNLPYYKVHAITDRKMIEKIHDLTNGFGPIHADNNYTGEFKSGKHENEEYKTNSQVLGNLLLAFTENTEDIHQREKNDVVDEKVNHDDRMMAVGIAAGYVNLTSTMLGYSTGCCKCFESDEVNALLDAPTLLLMGIGYDDPTRHRREHHVDKDFKFPTLKKEIEVIVHE
jgi:nitroreductase|tara:strand:- start:72 stop:713 length:642 start_codon:yes stop_codon:yes gene_type:complete